MVREAIPEDAAELVRLRGLMFAEMGIPGPDGWQPLAERILRKELAEAGGERRYGAFVIDDPSTPGRLAACAVGTLEQRLPAPLHPTGLFGFVFSICTDPGQRRRGYGRACTEALLAWFDARGATRVDLHATEDGEQLYRELGFEKHSVPLSRHHLTPRP